MNLDELAQVGLNAPLPEVRHLQLMPRERWFELGKKAATDAIIAAILRSPAATPTPGDGAVTVHRAPGP